MKKYLTGKQVLDTYQIEEIELFELMAKQGLQPHDKFGNPLPDPILQMFDVAIKEQSKKVNTIKQYTPKTSTIGIKIQKPILKPEQDLLNGFKLLREGYINFKKDSGATGTWQMLRLQNNKESKALTQFSTLRDAIYLKKEVEKLLGQPNHKDQVSIKRSNVTAQKYIWLVNRARTVIKDLLHDNCLAATRPEKFKQLMEDREFQNLVATLNAREGHIIRKLGKAGVWKIAKKSDKKLKRENSKRYRKSSLYKS